MAGAERAARLNAKASTGRREACHGQPFPDDRSIAAWLVPPVVAPPSALIMVAIARAGRSFA